MAWEYGEFCIPKIPMKFGIYEWLLGLIFVLSAFFAVNLIA